MKVSGHALVLSEPLSFVCTFDGLTLRVDDRVYFLC